MRKLKLIDGISLENHEEQEINDLDSVMVVVDPATGDDTHAIAVIEKTIDDGVEIKTILENVHDIVERSQEHGGLDTTSAELLINFMDNGNKVLKEISTITENKSILPSVENYGFLRLRQSNTQVALESIKERIQSFWKWLVTKLKELGKAIKDYYDRNTTFLSLLERRLNRVKRALTGVSMSNASREMYNPSLANGLSVQGRFPENLIQQIETFISVTDSVLNWHDAKYVEENVQLLKQLSNNTSFVTKNAIRNILSVPMGFKPGQSRDGYIQKFESADIFGNRRVICMTITDINISDQDLARNIEEVGGRLEYIEPTRNPSDKIKIHSLNDLKRTLDYTQIIIDKIRDYKKDLGRIFRLLNELESFSSTQMNKLPSTSNEEARVRQQLIQNLAISIPKIVRQPVLNYTSHASNVARMLVAYVELSIRTTNQESNR